MFLSVRGRIYPLEAPTLRRRGADVVSSELFQPTPAGALLLPTLNPTEDTPIHDLSLVPGASFAEEKRPALSIPSVNVDPYRGLSVRLCKRGIPMDALRKGDGCHGDETRLLLIRCI